MAGKEFQLLETRSISGRGLFRIPANDAYRHFYLYINVIRLPRVNFTNSKFNPDKSEYAKITWIRNDYVLREDAMNFENQLFEFSPDPSHANYINQGMVCLYESIIAYLDYLAPFIPAPPLASGEPIPINPLRNTPTEVKIVCRESTAIVAKLYYLEYEEACGSAEATPVPPPDPMPEPQQPTPAPIGDLSPPYQSPDDDGDTVPYPGDANPPPDPSIGEPCVPGTLTIIVSYSSSGEPQTPVTRVVAILGKIDPTQFFLNDPEQGNASCYHQGYPSSGCGEFQKRLVVSLGLSAVITDVEFVSYVQ